MDTFGKHILCELSGCSPDILNNIERVREIMLAAALQAGATVIGESFHRFQPQGVSGVVVISESHLSIHTWPERGYAALDFYTCGNIDPSVAMSYAATPLGAKSFDVVTVHRGIDHDGNFTMQFIDEKCHRCQRDKNDPHHSRVGGCQFKRL